MGYKYSGTRRSGIMSKEKAFKFKWTFFLAGMVSIVIGYILLGLNDITVAPILLVLGYCVLVPMAFL
jgi:hypothetical protein